MKFNAWLPWPPFTKTSSEPRLFGWPFTGGHQRGHKISGPSWRAPHWDPRSMHRVMLVCRLNECHKKSHAWHATTIYHLFLVKFGAPLRLYYCCFKDVHAANNYPDPLAMGMPPALAELRSQVCTPVIEAPIGPESTRYQPNTSKYFSEHVINIDLNYQIVSLRLCSTCQNLLPCAYHVPVLFLSMCYFNDVWRDIHPRSPAMLKNLCQCHRQGFRLSMAASTAWLPQCP